MPSCAAQQLARQAPAPLEELHELYVRLGTDARRPDLAVIRGDAPVARRQLGVESAHVVLIVEVVSPSSRKTDRFFKPVEYAGAGIPAYWRVETEGTVSLTAYVLAPGQQVYTEVGTWREGETTHLTRPTDLTVDIDALVP